MTNVLVAGLQSATLAFAKGELGERELIAITMATNDALSESLGDSYKATAEEAMAAMIERIAELDRGEP